MLSQLLISLVTQPLIWGGLLAGYFVSRYRIHSERRLFHIAIDSQLKEFKTFCFYSAFWGVILSLLFFFIGLKLPASFWLLYQISGIGALFLAGLVIWPSATLLVAIVAWLLLWQLTSSVPFSFMPTAIFTDYSAVNRVMAASLFLLLTLSAWLSALLRQRYALKNLSPRISRSHRGRRVGYFKTQQLALIPLVFLVPGTKMTAGLWQWTTLHLAGTDYHLLVLPLLVGFLITIRHQLPQTVIKRQVKLQVINGIIFLLSAGLVYFWPRLFMPLLGLALVVTVINWLIGRRQGKIVHYTQPFNGVMILGIQPETPAAKMALTVGDTILECNHRPVYDEDSFYAARMADATYCYLRVKSLSGDIKITESAIFSDSPHNLGIMTFPETVE